MNVASIFTEQTKETAGNVVEENDMSNTDTTVSTNSETEPDGKTKRKNLKNIMNVVSRKSERKKQTPRSFSPDPDHGPGTHGSSKRKQQHPRHNLRSVTAANRQCDILPDGKPFQCGYCNSPYVVNRQRKQALRDRRSKHTPIPKTVVEPTTGKAILLCNACSEIRERPQKKKKEASPTSEEDKQKHLESCEAFGKEIAEKLGNPNARKLYCPIFKSGTPCNCLQKYVKKAGKEEYDARLKKIFTLHTKAQKLSKLKCYLEKEYSSYITNPNENQDSAADMKKEDLNLRVPPARFTQVENIKMENKQQDFVTFETIESSPDSQSQSIVLHDSLSPSTNIVIGDSASDIIQSQVNSKNYFTSDSLTQLSQQQKKANACRRRRLGMYIGIGNGQKRSKLFETFVLEQREHLKKDLRLCERAVQRVLCYSNNFLHKRLKTENRLCRLQPMKGQHRKGSLMSMEEIARTKCCVDNCSMMASTHQALLKVWRDRAKKCQAEARRVIAEMLIPTAGVRCNCYKFITMVTGLSRGTICRVNTQMRETGGDREPPEHGLKKKKREKPLQAKTKTADKVTGTTNPVRDDTSQGSVDRFVNQADSMFTENQFPSNVDLQKQHLLQLQQTFEEQQKQQVMQQHLLQQTLAMGQGGNSAQNVGLIQQVIDHLSAQIQNSQLQLQNCLQLVATETSSQDPSSTPHPNSLNPQIFTQQPVNQMGMSSNGGIAPQNVVTIMQDNMQVAALPSDDSRNIRTVQQLSLSEANPYHPMTTRADTFQTPARSVTHAHLPHIYGIPQSPYPLNEQGINTVPTSHPILVLGTEYQPRDTLSQTYYLSQQDSVVSHPIVLGSQSVLVQNSSLPTEGQVTNPLSQHPSQLKITEASISPVVSSRSSSDSNSYSGSLSQSPIDSTSCHSAPNVMVISPGIDLASLLKQRHLPTQNTVLKTLGHQQHIPSVRLPGPAASVSKLSPVMKNVTFAKIQESVSRSNQQKTSQVTNVSLAKMHKMVSVSDSPSEANLTFLPKSTHSSESKAVETTVSTNILAQQSNSTKNKKFTVPQVPDQIVHSHPHAFNPVQVALQKNVVATNHSQVHANHNPLISSSNQVDPRQSHAISGLNQTSTIYVSQVGSSRSCVFTSANQAVSNSIQNGSKSSHIISNASHIISNASHVVCNSALVVSNPSLVVSNQSPLVPNQCHVISNLSQVACNQSQTVSKENADVEKNRYSNFHTGQNVVRVGKTNSPDIAGTTCFTIQSNDSAEDNANKRQPVYHLTEHRTPPEVPILIQSTFKPIKMEQTTHIKDPTRVSGLNNKSSQIVKAVFKETSRSVKSKIAPNKRQKKNSTNVKTVAGEKVLKDGSSGHQNVYKHVAPAIPGQYVVEDVQIHTVNDPNMLLRLLEQTATESSN